jgi:3-dehydroquinate synthase
VSRTVRVALGERSYEVRIGRGLVDDVSGVRRVLGDAQRVAIVTQARVADHVRRVADGFAELGLAVDRIEVPDGETAKSPETLVHLWEELAAIPLGRRDVVVAVGGGVVGDLAGFAAASWHRGVDVVQVPTTLLAQVDAAIGGKTGINLPAGKNLVGAFHQPVAVLCDVDVLATLPRRQLVAGLAEVVKCGLIRDPAILDILEDDPEAAVRGEADVLEELVARSVAVKAAVVAADERESGEREHLNLGHTIGHALEAVTDYTDLLHGEAVSIGMCAELRLGLQLGVTPEELIPRVESLLARLGLPARTPPLDRRAVWEALVRDKKARDGVRFVVLEDVGRPTVTTAPDHAVDSAIDAVEEQGSGGEG